MTCSETGPSGKSPSRDGGRVEGGDDARRSAGAARCRTAAPTPCGAPRPPRGARSGTPSGAPSGPASPTTRSARLRRILSLSGAFLHRVAHALRAPLPLGAGAGDEVGLLVGELLVGLAGVPPGDRPLLEEGVVAAVVDRDLALGEVELDDAGDAAGQELAVVGDQRRRRRAGRGRTTPAARDRRGRGRWWARRAAPRRSGSAAARRAPREPPAHRRAWSSGRPGRRRGRARPATGGSTVLEVRRAGRQPVVQRDGVRVGAPRGPPTRAPRRRPPSPRSPRSRPCGGRGSRRSSRRRRARAPAAASPRRRPTGAVDTRPAIGADSPASSRSSVDLPAPLAPTTPTTSPGATVRFRDSKRVRCPWPPARSFATRVPVTGPE